VLIPWGTQRGQELSPIQATERLGVTVREGDYDRVICQVRQYDALNFPAAVIKGTPESLLVGAIGLDPLIERLQRFVG
jgi:hypothetical protein